LVRSLFALRLRPVGGAEVEKAKQAWLAAAREAGKPIPEPR
jgi:hypothetical protein